MAILLDIESRSRADLKALGGRRYWEHLSTETVCVVWHDTDAGDGGVWLPGDPIPAFVAPGAPLAAHNMMGFDRFGLHAAWGHAIDDEALIDTAQLARRAGMPGALDELAKRWLGTRKDHSGNRVTMALSGSPVTGDKVCKETGEVLKRGVPEGLKAPLREYKRACKRVIADGAGHWAPIPDDVLDAVVEYCISDVQILIDTWDELEPWQDYEPDVQRAERAINERGVYLDVPLAKRLLEEDARISQEVIDASAEVLGMHPDDVRALAGSPKMICEALDIDDATKPTVQALLDDEASGPEVHALCRARQAIASIARGKLLAGLRRVCPDGRLRDAQAYMAAHTWRWGGRGMQLQNLPRPAGKYEEWTGEQIDKLAIDVTRGRQASAEEINLLLRACLCAAPGNGLAVSDFKGVEARALAWFVGDEGELETIRTGRDAYSQAATHIFAKPYDEIDKIERAAGKVSVLACGYQGGHRALSSMALTLGVDLSQAAASPKQIVQAWRDSHPKIVQLWHDVERAFGAACHGQASWVSCFEFTPAKDGGSVAIWMPSGRPLVYQEARVKRVEKFGRMMPGLVHLGEIKPGLWGEVHTYGGKLTENITQSFCRDLMAAALVRAEDAGLCPSMHVHDEQVCDIHLPNLAEGAELLDATMLDLPRWAEGFPIGCDGFTGKRFRK